MEPGNIEPAGIGRNVLCLDLVKGERRRIDQARPGRAMREELPRYDRAGIEADRAAGEEVAAADGYEVGRTRAGADEMDGHGFTVRQ